MWETKVQSPGLEDLLEKEMATHSSILAWRIPWTEEPGGLQSMGSHRVGHAEWLRLGEWAMHVDTFEVYLLGLYDSRPLSLTFYSAVIYSSSATKKQM